MKLSCTSESYYVNNQERVSLLSLRLSQNHILTILRQCLGPPRHYCFLSTLQGALPLYNPQTVDLLALCNAVSPLAA